MRTRVVARSFYEDAYLGFFIRYYLDLGFNEVVILKADANIFGGPKVPQYAIDNGLITQEELDSGRIIIKAVKNTGNDIIKEYYSEFLNPNIDWVLQIDLDEFLVIDTKEYPGGINEYIERTKQRLYDEKRILDPEYLQQIKFRWLCINKMDVRFKSNELNTINKLLTITNTDTTSPDTTSPDTTSPDTTSPDTDNMDKLRETITNEVVKEGLTMLDYVSKNKLEMFSFLKSLAAVKYITKNSNLNCHFFILNVMDKIHEMDKKKHETMPKDIEIRKRRIYTILDDQFLFKNIYKSSLPAQSDKSMKYGFVLHLNTRSLANALTKCLVTKLRDNKKITNMNDFKIWINQLKCDNIYKLALDRGKHKIAIDNITNKFMSYLNSKSYFPKKIAYFHNKFKDRLDLPATLNMLDNVISNLPIKTRNAMIGDVETEWAQLQVLCKKNGINYDNIKAVLELF